MELPHRKQAKRTGAVIMTDPMVEKPIDAQEYALGLLNEETSEVGLMVGKAIRFGIDTPGPDAAPYYGMTAREALNLEAGDVMAAIDYACTCGLLNAEVVTQQAGRKLRKLLNPEARDNLGRRLAPDPKQGGAS
jgi:hypothetical protein